MSEQQVVQRAIASLGAFDEVAAAIAKYEEKNKSLIFELSNPAGMKEARSHIYSLRQVKSKIAFIHKDQKAEVLQAGRDIDTRKNQLTDKVNDMIEVQFAPIKLIEDAAKKAEEERIAAEKAEADRKEQERLHALKVAEEKLAADKAEFAEIERVRAAEIMKAGQELAAELKAQEDEWLERVRIEDARYAKIRAEHDKLATERLAFEAEKKAEADAKLREEQARKDEVAKAEREKKEAAEKAEQEKADAIKAEQDKADKLKAELEAKESAAKLEEERVAGVERKRVADVNHRKSICNDIFDAIDKLIVAGFDAERIVDDMIDGKIPHVSIKY